MKKRYKLRWDLKFDCGEFSKKKLGGRGGTDALVVASLLYPDDGSFSATWYSYDGRHQGRSLEDEEVFKLWALMAIRLSESETLGEGHRVFLTHVHEAIRDVFLSERSLGTGTGTRDADPKTPEGDNG